MSSVEATSLLELWHHRLGHPFENLVKLIPHVSNKDHLDIGCEVCMYAKHLRDKFSFNENKASRIFEKIHCDLWLHIDMLRHVELVIFDNC